MNEMWIALHNLMSIAFPLCWRSPVEGRIGADFQDHYFLKSVVGTLLLLCMSLSY